MSTQSDRFTKMLEEAPLDKRIEFAEMVRAALVQQVANTLRVLDPKELRDIDAGIKLLKSQRN
jgi:hypothetical protein